MTALGANNCEPDTSYTALIPTHTQGRGEPASAPETSQPEVAAPSPAAQSPLATPRPHKSRQGQPGSVLPSSGQAWCHTAPASAKGT